MIQIRIKQHCLCKCLLPVLLLCSLSIAFPSLAQGSYEQCIADKAASDTPLRNDPPHLKPLGVQSGIVNQPIRIHLELCDPEGEAPGTIAANMPKGASLPDNGDGTRSFAWTPAYAVDTEITFTVYEESDRSIRTSITVPFTISESPAAQAQSVSAQNFAVSLSPDIPVKGTSENAVFPVSGKVIAVAGTNLPGNITYALRSINGELFDSGKLTVDRLGYWQGQLQLQPGLNHIEFSIDDTQESHTISVTFNPGYTFSGLLELVPDVAYVDEPRLFTARIALTDPATQRSEVHLINARTDEIVAIFSDDGDLSNGDEIEADAVYSAMFSINANTPDTNNYLVRITKPDNSVARSESVELLVTQRLNAVELNDILHQQSTYEAALMSAAEDDVERLLLSITEELNNNPLVAEAGISEGGSGVWFVYKNGIAGAVYAPAAGTKGGSSAAVNNMMYAKEPLTLTGTFNSNLPPAPYSKYCRNTKPGTNTMLLDSGAATSTQLLSKNLTNKVKSSKVLAIAAQYWDWGESDDVPQMQRILSEDECHDVTYKRYSAKGNGSVEDFKNLGDYGAILISSHGDSFYAGIDSSWQQRFGWNGSTGQVVVDSNMHANVSNIATYEDDLHTGRLVIWGSSLGITPTFISEYSGSLPNSLVYMSICRGTWNASMATAFLNNGAGTFLGYDNYVTVAFCLDTGPALLNTLLEDGLSLQQAFIPGQFDPYTSGVVEFDLLGADDLALQAGELQDASFEQLQLSQAWHMEGDARLIQSLGEFGPTEGNAMAIISTGLGFTPVAGTLTQQICLCNGTTHIGFDWNFLSEEWLEYVGSGFQDSFTVRLLDTQSDAKINLFNTDIDTEAQNVVPVNHSFDQNNVYATGWRSFSGEVPASLRGKSVSLQFDVLDMGDSIFDSAVLLDNVRITCNDPIQAYYR